MVKVLHHVAVMDRGGQETFIMNVFRKIDRSKVSFDFLCTLKKKGDFDKEIRQLGGNILYVDRSKIKNPLKLLANTYHLYKKLREIHGDYTAFHIHTQHAMDGFLSALAAKCGGFQTVIVHSHNTNTDFHRNMHFVFRPLLNLLPIKRFACSKAAGQWMYGNMNFKVINNAIDTEAFRFKEDERKRIREAMDWSGKYVIGHVGRFAKQKNHRFLIDIFEKVHIAMPESILVLCGTGELLSEIQNYVIEKDLERYVEFLGTRKDIDSLYQGMDLFCFPSFYEGLPVTLVEAQASDLPCLISEIVTDDIVINRNIVKLPVKDNKEEWAEKIVEMTKASFNREDRRQNMRKAGYDMRHVAKDLENMYLQTNMI